MLIGCIFCDDLSGTETGKAHTWGRGSVPTTIRSTGMARRVKRVQSRS
ncbi:DUF7558 family protein [Natrinema hispanicum]